MTISNETAEARELEYDRLVTPEFAPLAEFAGFGAYEAVAVQETGKVISGFTDDIAEAISGYLMARPESAPLMSGSDPPVNPLLLKEWLGRTISGPFDGELSAFLREVSHVGGKGVTFPGVQVPLPPQLILLSLRGYRENHRGLGRDLRRRQCFGGRGSMDEAVHAAARDHP